MIKFIIPKFLFKIYRYFKKLNNHLIYLKECDFFYYLNNTKLINRHNYKLLISKYPTSWYENFEKAVFITEIIKPKIIVDLGVDFGFSTFSFAYAGYGVVYGIDSFEGDLHAGTRNTYNLVSNLNGSLKKANISEVIFIKGYFEDVVKSWDKKIDILHIDGLHTYNAVKRDFYLWKNHFHEDTLVLFHDTISFKNEVGKFFNELDGYKYNFKNNCGLGVWSLNEEYIRQIKYFYS